MQPEENLASSASEETPASTAGNETSAVSAGNASTASHAGMDRNAGWDMLASFMNRMKEHELNGTWHSYRPGENEPETEEE
ncbi:MULTISPECIES: hypothetical protein [Actinomycetaceae]|uniref:Uncharacterized protein n=1 Tax=Actinotignum sanguinis TaxID=1445614 RepID=A0ABT5V8S7_9ACTO|nr:MULTISPECIES: hypothetical protein [Actinotignum]MDE1552508.1 hypothetical protein [Actinotignum sanguinis]MDE1642028.1 hypothetical protein [Actinotignum sanguinis]MDE1657199.1 hypothetical protein [Actinotignum sanguinis]MDK6907409.1 hypothetical protein [Actinotignum timonense]MDK8352737.1 hypothetical protein [Actinotignum sanguinis]